MNDRPEPAVASLTDSYASNALVIKLATRRFIIRPTTDADADVDRIPLASSWRLPMHLVSAWNPQGEPTTFEGNSLHQARLEDAVAKRTHDWLRGTLIGNSNAWFEQAAAISGYTDKQAIALGKRFKQAAVIRVDREGWHVLPTGLHEDVEPVSRGWRLYAQSMRVCPMRLLSSEPAPCRMHGGPYGSLAISAAAEWAQKRRVAFALLGCDDCETRATDVPEQGLILNPDKEWCVASRHGRSIVRNKARRKYYIQAAAIGDGYSGLEEDI